MSIEQSIKLDETPTSGRYSYGEPGKAEAELTFSKLGDHAIIIDHTGVPDIYKGQGIGLKLLERAVEDTKIQGKKILPLCPFAAAQFRRHSEWQEMLFDAAKH